MSSSATLPERSPIRLLRLTAICVLLSVSSACQKPSSGTGQESPTPSPSLAPSTTPPGLVAMKPIPVEFIDVTQAAGISFKHNNGAAGKKYFPERFGSGCAFLDFDNDGWLDILLVNSTDLVPAKKARTSMALYRNNQNGTFTDVTAISGLSRPMYGIGTAVADFDNDGWTDIFVTGLGQCRLYRNTGEGRFIDVTAKMKLDAPMLFPTGAIWFDYDKDGKLDLFVNNYVDWVPDKDVACGADGPNKTYCNAESYAATTPRLFKNLGPFFVDVTAQAALDDAQRRSLGAVVVDYDRDGWPDLLLTNDGGPNALYHNNGRGQFTETAVTAGVAVDEPEKLRRARGADAADFDHSGLPSFVIGYGGEMVGLYHNKGKAGGLFVNESVEAGIGPGRSDSFGVLFLDYDLDGWQDLLVINSGETGDSTSARPLRLFRNEGTKKFTDVSRNAGKALQRAVAGRGAAYGDYDRDGDLDLLITTNGGAPYLLRNDHGNQNRFIRFRTIGTTSNRGGIGTRIAVFLPDGSRLGNWVRSGSGYCSQGETDVTFGLGRVDRVPRVEIEWPSGKSEKLENLAVDQVYTLKEGSGISH
ncbi:MAG: CRTAC1 family protein [Acidobacteriota bacterium]